MSIKFYNIISILIYTLFLTLLSRCTKNSVPDESKETLSINQFSITVNIPSGSLPNNVSKSGQTVTESQVNEIEVLVFENGSYAYKVVGEDLTQNNNSAVFHARLRSSIVPTTLYIIANNNAIINANEPPIGTSIDQAKTLFNNGFSASGVAGNVALWGSYTLASGINGSLQNELNDIVLLRAIARVDVEVAPTASNFVLQTIQVFRAANVIQIIPNSPNSELSVTTPSIPVGSLYNVNTTPVNVNFPTASTSQIYIPEAAAPDLANQVAQATCIVVGGRYNNSASIRYYRLDFNPQLANHPLGQILRNCRYDFTISEINADGYDSALEASNNPSSNMDFELVIWPSDQIDYMFFDNLDFFGLSHLYAGLDGIIGYTKQIDIATNLSSYSLRFGESGTWQQTLNDGTFSVTRTNGDQALVVTALTNNFTGSYRNQTMQIQAGNLDPITVQLIQYSSPPRIEWATRNVAAFRTFAANINSYGSLYQWNRTAAFTAASGGTVPPAGWNSVLSTSLVWSVANDPCPLGWRLPTSEEWILFRIMYPFLSARSTQPNNGFFFATTQEEADNATFANPGNTIFLPGTGRRTDAGTYQNAQSDFAYYWSSNRTSTAFSHFYLRRQELTNFGTGTSANTVRCVRDL